jgi:hypothetical protein
MHIPENHSFDPETLAQVREAFELAWAKIPQRKQTDESRSALAEAVMQFAKERGRDRAAQTVGEGIGGASLDHVTGASSGRGAIRLPVLQAAQRRNGPIAHGRLIEAAVPIERGE